MIPQHLSPKDKFGPLWQYLPHLACLMVMALVLWILSLGNAPVAWVVSARAPEPSPTLQVSEPESVPLPSPAFFIRASVPHTTIAQHPRLEAITYTVQAGDTVYGIAEQFGVSPDTVLWANGRLEENPDLLRIGQQLVIPPVTGVYHIIEEGDTLSELAARYKAEVSAILSFEGNQLALLPDNTLIAGQPLMIPGGEKPYVPRHVHIWSGEVPADATRGTGSFGWPVSGVITQKYWERHKAIDIGAPAGSKVVAADSGYVAIAGWSDLGYGRVVLIDHGNGFQTLYAHLSVYYVEAGTSVGKGTVIGTVGSTGNATGPHLHFEIRKNGVLRNPLGFLP